MKEVNSKNQIWWESTNSILKVGFTRSFLDILADATAWHILPGNLKLIKPKSPLFAVETNDSLISVSAPIDGKVQYWNRKAQDMPDKLVETDVVLELTTPIVLSKEQLTLLESLKKEAFEYWSKMRDSKRDIKERVIQQDRYNTLASKLDHEFGIDANELVSIMQNMQPRQTFAAPMVDWNQFQLPEPPPLGALAEIQQLQPGVVVVRGG